MTGNSLTRNHGYRHSLFFGNWSKETEKQAEDAEAIVIALVDGIEDSTITMEEGEPVELSFYTPDRIVEFNQGYIVRATSPDSYRFNTEDL